MYQFTNLPPKHGWDIEGVVTETGYRIQTEDGWEICTVSRATDEATARDIADAIQYARDRGYEQAQADMQRALGLDR